MPSAYTLALALALALTHTQMPTYQQSLGFLLPIVHGYFIPFHLFSKPL